MGHTRSEKDATCMAIRAVWLYPELAELYIDVA